MSVTFSSLHKPIVIAHHDVSFELTQNIISPLTPLFHSQIIPNMHSIPDLFFSASHYIISIQKAWESSKKAYFAKVEGWFVQGYHPEYLPHSYHPHWSGSSSRPNFQASEELEITPQEQELSIPIQNSNEPIQSGITHKMDADKPSKPWDRPIDPLESSQEFLKSVQTYISSAPQLEEAYEDLFDYLIFDNLLQSDDVKRRKWHILNWINSNPSLVEAFQQMNLDGNNLAHVTAALGPLELFTKLASYPPLRHQLAQTHFPNNLLNVALFAVFEGNLEVVHWIFCQPDLRHLLQQTFYDNEQTLAHIAGASEHLHILEWMVKNTFDLLFQEDSNGESFFHRAAYNGHLSVLQWGFNQIEELKSILRVDILYLNTLLRTALEQGHEEIVKWIDAIQSRHFSYLKAD